MKIEISFDGDHPSWDKTHEDVYSEGVTDGIKIALMWTDLERIAMRRKHNVVMR